MKARTYVLDSRLLSITEIGKANGLARNSAGLRIQKAGIKSGGDVTKIFLVKKYAGAGKGKRSAAMYLFDGKLMSIKGMAAHIGKSHSYVWLRILNQI